MNTNKDKDNKIQKLNLSIDLNECQLSATEGDDWQISGYATVFDNLNSHEFSISKGAYAAIIQSGVQPKMFFNHNSWNVPIGKWVSLKEDDKGLYVEGILTKGVALAQDVYHAVKAGTLDGLSVGIGYWWKDVLEKDDGTYEVTKISTLSEISVVNRPSDDQARVDKCLSADEADDLIDSIDSIRSAENNLRVLCGISRKQAGRLIAQLKACMSDPESKRDSSEGMKQLQAVFNSIRSKLNES